MKCRTLRRPLLSSGTEARNKRGRRCVVRRQQLTSCINYSAVDFGCVFEGHIDNSCMENNNDNYMCNQRAVDKMLKEPQGRRQVLKDYTAIILHSKHKWNV